MIGKSINSGACVGLFGLIFLCAFATAGADENDPPTRIARIADAEGSVSLQPGGTQDWVAAPLNRPLTTGDKLWSDRDSRVELQLDGSILRLSSNTAMSFLNLGDEVTQVQLTAGTLLIRVRRLDDNETYEIDTPNLAFSLLRPGLYRVTVDDTGNTTAVLVRNGQGEVTGGGTAYSLHAGEYDLFSGTDQLVEDQQGSGPGPDDFDAWSNDRDARWDRSVSSRYVSADVVGSEDLDDNGSWRPTPDYGYVWYPSGVEPGWAPYHSGHWSYIEPWGYTWVDDQRWGFAPFHYGRWIWSGGAWGWVPTPPHPSEAEYVRPVYAPALVAWVGVGAGIAWFALGPREVYVPSYPVSRNYVRNINVSNTTVNNTVVNNIYNTTIINNKTVNVTNVTYVNRTVPGAVAATSVQAFTTAQPVARNLVHVEPHAIASAQIHALAPAEVPSKQAVLGAGKPAVAKPPAALQSRTVVARVAPPPAPPSFERRQAAIQSNGGKLLSLAQSRQLQPAGATRTVQVRIAPPATPMPVSRTQAKPVAANGAGNPVPMRSDRPPNSNVPMSRPAPAAIHASELPAAARPASPSTADSMLERQHLQQQQQLRAQQQAERQQVQQQQNAEHAQLAKQQADQARQQELEQQHQQQTQQLQQKHMQEQQQQQAQQQQAQQQQQRRAMEAPSRPAVHQNDRPPGARSQKN